MKKAIIALLALSAVLMTACSESPSEGNSVKPVEPTNTTTTAAETAKTEETTAETTTTAEPETTTEKPTETQAESKAEESSQVDESEPEMNGTGGDEETELYRLYGCWESDGGNMELHIWDNNYELLMIEASESGHLEYKEQDGQHTFILAPEPAKEQDLAYIMLDHEKTGSLSMIQGMGAVRFTYMSDLIPREVFTPDVGMNYDGEVLTDPVNINFEARTDLTDVNLLKLELVDMNQNGEPLFKTKSLLNVPKLEEGQNFSPDVEIPEVIPTYGISYRDEHGNEHYFDISMSGMDGSIVLTPFTPSN